MKFFYTQLLTGDTADNIKGVKGIGPKKADKILDGLVAEADLYKAVEEHYETLDELIENARLLWLRRFEGQMWEPPE
jgi:5'-3' exonuclease